MPKLYPDLLKDQDILDVAAYLHADIAKNAEGLPGAGLEPA